MDEKTLKAAETRKRNAERRAEMQRIERERQTSLRDSLHEIVASAETTAGQKLQAAEMILELDGKRRKRQ